MKLSSLRGASGLTVVGFALAVVPDIWDSFSEKDKANVESWLGNSINEKKSASTSPCIPQLC
jgi:hypothetical protein